MLVGTCRLIGPSFYSPVFADGHAAPLPAFGHPLPGGEGSVGSPFIRAARLPSPARAAWPSALNAVAGEGRGWGNIELSFVCARTMGTGLLTSSPDHGERPLQGRGHLLAVTQAFGLC